jgi:L-seryl-tRNA(Ser) seleniumtransferase
VSTLLPVINASGVVLHTNLGRAPLSRRPCRPSSQVARGYSNLEFDLERGQARLAPGARRGAAAAPDRRRSGPGGQQQRRRRAAGADRPGAPPRVVIARSQLVEIGGGFRIPDVMKQSGARLVEVGAPTACT